MRKWVVRFHGRLSGAIGISYPCEVVVEAPDAAAAYLKTYETHEHLSEVNVTEIPEGSAAR